MTTIVPFNAFSFQCIYCMYVFPYKYIFLFNNICASSTILYTIIWIHSDRPGSFTMIVFITRTPQGFVVHLCASLYLSVTSFVSQNNNTQNDFYYTYVDITILLKPDFWRRFPHSCTLEDRKLYHCNEQQVDFLFGVELCFEAYLWWRFGHARNGGTAVGWWLLFLHNTCLRDKTTRHWPNRHKDLVVMASCMAVFSFFQLHHIFFFSFSVTPQSEFILGTWWRRVWQEGLLLIPVHFIHSTLKEVTKRTEIRFVSTPSPPPTPSNCDCLHLVDSGRCIGRRPSAEISCNHSDSKAPSDRHRFSSHWWVHGDEGLEWFSHYVSSGKCWAGGGGGAAPRETWRQGRGWPQGSTCSPAGWDRPCAAPRTWHRNRCRSCCWEPPPLCRLQRFPASPSSPVGNPRYSSLTCTKITERKHMEKRKISN